MRHLFIFSVVLFHLVVSFVSVFASKSENNKMYIARFEVTGINQSVADEVRDYMSESLVDKYSLMSDDEVKVFLSNAEMNMLLHGGEDGMSRLSSAISADYLVFGEIRGDDEGITIDAHLMKNGDIVNVGGISYSKYEYTDRAARALGTWLVMDKKNIGGIFGKKDPRERFKEDIKKLEKKMSKIEDDYQKDSRSIRRSSTWRDESLVRSPVVRLGVSGLGLFPTFDDKTNNLYDPYFLAMGDLVFYRFKDPVGDGIDLYTRGTFRYFKGVDSYSKHIAASPYAGGPPNFRMFDEMPIEPPKLYVLSGDIGMRFVGSVYILRSAVSFYLGGALRLNSALRYTEYASGRKRESINELGGVGVAGIEFSIMPNLGLFTEFNAGYVPMGNDRINLEGPQIIAGLTFRTKHFD